MEVIGWRWIVACMGLVGVVYCLTQETSQLDDGLVKKPLGVSQQEYEEKNLAGYCWRDDKYYTDEELKVRANQSFVKYWMRVVNANLDDKVLDEGGKKIPDISTDCIIYSSCQIYSIDHSFLPNVDQQWNANTFVDTTDLILSLINAHEKKVIYTNKKVLNNINDV